jgi:tryptophanyl-tRNA synthetase
VPDIKKSSFPEKVLSGMRPTGRLHIGHYFGVLDNWLKLQTQYPCMFMVADFHAMTNADLSKSNIANQSREMLLDWLSVGIDPEKAIIFVQSSISQHAELYLLFSMLTSLGWLERNPTYKEQKTELGERSTGSLGFLAYPVLQTVDVAIYKATKVPVGEDQKPHLEMGRELVRRFNTTFAKKVFPEFEALLTPTPKLLGTDGRKMSKSYNNAIAICDSPDVTLKRVKSMLTDSTRPRREDPGHPELCNLFPWHSLFTDSEKKIEIATQCRAATLGCADDKLLLADRIIAWQAPFLKRRAELEKDLGYLDEVIAKGNAKARAIAADTMKDVWNAVGLWPPRI